MRLAKASVSLIVFNFIFILNYTWSSPPLFNPRVVVVKLD